MLNKKQSEFKEEILNGNERIYFLRGDAGTGKSYLISSLCKCASVELTATTNKAKKLLEHATNQSARTIHSFAGFRLARYGEELFLDEVGVCGSASILVIDEVSMLPARVWEVVKSNPLIEKIILVGDMCQLPSIGIGIDPIKEADKVLTLTENMRQDDFTSVADFFKQIRDCITQQMTLKFSNIPSCVVVYDSFREFAKAYKDCQGSKRILAYSNRVVDSYNRNIAMRKRGEYAVGDTLILSEPVKGTMMKNGDSVFIKHIFTDNDKFIELSVGSSVGYGEGKITIYKTKEAEQLYINHCMSNGLFSELDNLHHPKFEYASTIHKCQGESIDEVFIDLTDMLTALNRVQGRYTAKPIEYDEFLKMLYVALSRMRYKAHIFKGNKRDYKILKERRSNAKAKNNA